MSLGTVGPELGVSARDDQESGDPSGTAVVDDGHDLVCGDGHDRDRRGLGDLLDRAVGGDAQHSLTGGHRRAIDRADGACEAAGHEVLQQTMPEGGGVTARAHHDDGVWCNQTHHRLSLGAMLARRTHSLGRLGGLDVERQRDHAVLEVVRRVVAGLFECHEHPAVARQHLRDESRDPVLSSGRGQVLEEHGPQPATLVVVTDDEGDLGIGVVDPVIATDADQLPADSGNQRHSVDVVDVGEAMDVALGQLGVGGKEAVVDRLVRQRAMERRKPIVIVGIDGADPHGTPVAHRHIGLPMGGRSRGYRDVWALGHAPQPSARHAEGDM